MGLSSLVTVARGLFHRVVNNMQEMKVEVGTTIVEQGQFPSKDDCMFVLQEGTVDVIIAGSGQTRRNDSEVSHDGRTIRMHKEPGWVFGDVALLLNSPRSASVVAKTNCALWTLSRGVFISVSCSSATLAAPRHLPPRSAGRCRAPRARLRTNQGGGSLESQPHPIDGLAVSRAVGHEACRGGPRSAFCPEAPPPEGPF